MATRKVAKKATKVSKTARVSKPAKTVKKATPKKGKELKKGDRYGCDVCGLVVRVDTACGCVDSSEIICCDEPMSPKK